MHCGNAFCAFQRLRLRFQLFFSFFFKRVCGCYEFPVGPVHCSQDPQCTGSTKQCTGPTMHGIHKPLYSTNFSLKMSLIALFTYLKIILLQCFSVFSGIQTDPKTFFCQRIFTWIIVHFIRFNIIVYGLIWT